MTLRSWLRIKQESRPVAKKPRDAAPVLFDLKFADNVQYKLVAKLRKPGFTASELQTHRRKTEFNAKWRF